MRLKQAVACLVLFFGLQIASTPAQQVVATWTDSSSNWSNAANWSTLTVPNNGGGTFYNAVVNGTGSDTITFDASGTVVNSLTIGAGETFQDNGLAPTLKIGDPSFPAAGSLINSGTINWGNGSNLTLDITAGNGSIANSGAINLTNSTLTINDGGNGNTAVLSGGGTVNLSGGTIAGSSGKETLQNIDNTIQGSGTIGNLTFINNGTINANGTTPFSLASGGFNTGTINVTGPGGLVLSGQFQNNGTLDINHSSLTGSYNTVPGPHNLAGGPLIIENGSTATLASMGNGRNFTAEGGTIVRNASTLNVGFIDNEDLGIEILGGSVVTSGGINNTHANLLIDNGTMNLGSYGAEFGNAHVIVQNGGTLNVLGNYNFLSGQDVGADNALISGKSVANILGQLLVPGSSTFTVDNSVLNVGGDLVNTTSDGGSTLILRNSSIGAIGGSIDNSFAGSITIDQSILTVRGNVSSGESSSVTLAGGSILNVAGNFSNFFAGAVLTMSGTNDVLNVQGLFTNVASVTTVGSLETLNANGGFLNSGGNVSISSGGILSATNYSQSSGLTDVSGNLTSQSYSQAGGNTIIETGGKLSATTFTATGGTVTVNGILDPTAVEIGSGAGLQGTGTIFGNVAMGGTLTPGAPGTPGTLTINGNYEQLSGGMLQEFMGPLSQSLLKVNGDVALDSGSFLEIILLNGYDPLGLSFNIIGYNSLVGEFSNGSSFWQDGFLWDLSYGQNGVEVTAVSTPEPSSLLLLFVGLAALASYAQQKKSKTQRLA